MVAKKKTPAKKNIAKKKIKAKVNTAARKAVKTVAKTKAKRVTPKATLAALKVPGNIVAGLKEHAKANAPGTPWMKHAVGILASVITPKV